MKKIIFVFLTILLSLDAWCQDNSQNQSTTLSDNSRFEIIQSELAVKLTFKIDKFNGKVYLLVQSGKDLTWQLMYIEKQDNDVVKENQVNYQIFTSGLGIKYTFLMNVNSGITWELAKDTESDELFWNKIQ